LDINSGSLSGNATLVAMPHKDNPDDGQYTFPQNANEDPPYFNDPGNSSSGPVVDSASITVDDGGGGEPSPATVSFNDQTSDGTTVTVESTFVPNGGFVAIHNATMLQEGAQNGNTSKIQESVIGVTDELSAGTHNNVVATLNINSGSLSGNATLVAMPHKDNPDDGQYTFPQNANQDPPYFNDPGNSSSGPVVDSASITVEQENVFTQPLVPEFSDPPTNTGELDPTLYEDLDGDGDGTEVQESVAVFGELVRGNDLGLTDDQARKLNWNPGSPATEVTIADIVTLFGEQIRAN
jgi:hypothetical protein